MLQNCKIQSIIILSGITRGNYTVFRQRLVIVI